MTAITDGEILSVLVAAGLVSDSVIISTGIIKAAKAKTNGAQNEHGKISGTEFLYWHALYSKETQYFSDSSIR